jgi:hypothetical protein
MANTKISALTGATTPLAGTEVLPIVQSSTTKQVSVANLTAGRAISATSVTASTGNFVVGTSGQGIDFSATPGTGTSELLADYEEGTWTPIVASSVGSITTYSATGKYTKVGRAVVLGFNIIITNNGTGAGFLNITGMPFAPAAANAEAGCGLEYAAFGFTVYNYFTTTTTIVLNSYANTYAGGTGNRLACQITYQV